MTSARGNRRTPRSVKHCADWFTEPEFTPVSAVIFTCDPRYQLVGDVLFHYGNFSWRWYNPNASHPWPNDLPSALGWAWRELATRYMPRTRLTA